MSHYARLMARPSDEFPERANPKSGEIASERPGELGAVARDEDLLYAALYDRALIEPLKKSAPKCQFRTSPLYELIRYRGTHTELSSASVSFAGTEVTVST